MADRLSLTRALEGSGMQSDVADRVATEIYDAIHNNVATKADIAAVRADLQTMEQRLNSRIDLVEEKLGHQIGTIVNRIVAAIVVAIGILFAALHYWPPHS